MFNINKTTKSLLLVMVLLVSTAGVAFAAAPTVDSETTDTSQTSDLTDGGTQTHNDTATSNLSWSADSANSSVEITQNGTTVYEASPDHYAENSTSGTYYYNVSLADDTSDYDGLEVGAGENATLNVTFTNDSNVDNPDTTNISFTYVNSEDIAFIASESPEGEDNDGEGFFSSLNVFSSDDEEDVGTQLSTDSTTINQNTSEVQLDTLSGNLTDAYAASTEDASEGDLIWSSYMQVAAGDDDARFLPVFYESADNDEYDWINTSEDTYATVSADGETMTIYNPDGLLDDGQTSATLDVTTVGDEMLGASNARAMLSSDQYDASTTKVWTTSFAASDFNGNQDFVTDTLEA